MRVVRNLQCDEPNLTASCWYKNLHFIATPLSLTLESGSLAKWMRSENLTGGLTPEHLEMALSVLDKDLRLNATRYSFKNALVLRVDLAANLIMKHPPYNYLQRLGALKEARRTIEYIGKKHRETGVTYTLPRGALCVYDKLAEMRAHRDARPRNFNHKNVLRIESRINSPSGNWADIRTYFTPKHYKQLIGRWLEYGLQLTPETSEPSYKVDNMDLIRKDFERWYAGFGIHKIGLNVYEARLTRAGLQKDAKRRELQRARENLKFYLDSLDNSGDELTDELREAIQQAHKESAELYPE